MNHQITSLTVEMLGISIIIMCQENVIIFWMDITHIIQQNIITIFQNICTRPAPTNTYKSYILYVTARIIHILVNQRIVKL